jgi:hypothetical protein
VVIFTGLFFEQGWQRLRRLWELLLDTHVGHIALSIAPGISHHLILSA